MRRVRGERLSGEWRECDDAACCRRGCVPGTDRLLPRYCRYSPSTTRPPHESSTVSGRAPGDSVVVGMYYEQEPIPYRFTVPGRVVTLEQIRHLNTKRGTYKSVFHHPPLHCALIIIPLSGGTTPFFLPLSSSIDNMRSLTVHACSSKCWLCRYPTVDEHVGFPALSDQLALL